MLEAVDDTRPHVTKRTKVVDDRAGNDGNNHPQKYKVVQEGEEQLAKAGGTGKRWRLANTVFEMVTEASLEVGTKLRPLVRARVSCGIVRREVVRKPIL